MCKRLYYTIPKKIKNNNFSAKKRIDFSKEINCFFSQCVQAFSLHILN